MTRMTALWGGEPPIKFQIYPERNTWPVTGNWRWRLCSRNGRILADSGESYSSKSNCRRAVNRLIDLMVDWAASAGLEIEVLSQ